MWRKTCLLGILCCVLPFDHLASGADPVATDLERVKESKAKWERARDAAGGDYSYQVVRVFFVGREATTITVRGNKVTQRSFEQSGPPQPIKPGDAPPKATPKWIETGKDIGSHGKEGAAAMTVDQLYEIALKVAGEPVPENHRRILGFNDMGLLSHCFTLDTRIADDAPTHGVGPIVIQLPAKK